MTDLTRRAFAVSLAATPIAAMAGAAATTGWASGAKAGAPRPPLATIKVGRFEVTALTDGYYDMPYGFFTGREPSAIETAANEAFAAGDKGVRLSFNQFLVRDGDQLILIDTGPDATFPTTGGLPNALGALGVKPDDIDAVVLTHLHMDHISGAVAGGRQVFRNAEVFADRRDVTYWTDPAKKSGAPDFLKSSFNASEALVRLYPKLNRIDGEREIARGVSIVDLTGHTPGHIGVRIADAGESLIMVSDMMFHPAVHPGAADIGFAFEQDPAAARLDA